MEDGFAWLREPGFVWVLVAIVALAAESVIAVAWWPPYFRIGIPMFRLSFPIQSSLAEVPAAWSFEGAFGVWMPQIVFRKLSNVELAFREAQVGFALFRSFSVMHGVLRLVPDKRRWEIVGYANLSTFFLVGAVVGSVPAGGRLLTAAAFIVSLIIPYAIQAYRFGRLQVPMKQYIAACDMAAESRAVSPIRQT